MPFTVACIRNRGQTNYSHTEADARALVNSNSRIRLGLYQEMVNVARVRRQTWCTHMWFQHLETNTIRTGYPSINEWGSADNVGCQVVGAPGAHYESQGHRTVADVFIAVEGTLSTEELQRILPAGKEIVYRTVIYPWIKKNVYLIHGSSSDCEPGYANALRYVPGTDRVAFGALDPVNPDFIWRIDYVHGIGELDFKIENMGAPNASFRCLMMGDAPYHNAHAGPADPSDRALVTVDGSTNYKWKWRIEETSNGRIVLHPTVRETGRLVREECQLSAFVDFGNRVQGDDVFVVIGADSDDLMGNLNGGSPSSARCPPHHVLTGIETKSTNGILTQVSKLRCTSVNDLLAQRLVHRIVSYPNGGMGEEGDTSVIQDCDAGKMVVGMSTQIDETLYGGAVAGMALACRAPGQDGNPQITRTSGRRTGKNTRFQACGRGALPSGAVVGVRTRAGGIVDAIGIECSDQVRPRPLFPSTPPASLRDTPNQPLGLSNLPVNRISCPSGKALTGVDAITDNEGNVVGINSISCADMDYIMGRRNDSSGYVGVPNTSIVPAGTQNLMRCPRGAVSSVLGRFDGENMTALRLACRDTSGTYFSDRSAGDLEALGDIGMHACQGNGVATGVRWGATNNRLKTVGIECSTVPPPPAPPAPVATSVTGLREIPPSLLGLPEPSLEPSTSSSWSTFKKKLFSSGDAADPPPPVPNRREATLNGTTQRGLGFSCPGDKLMVGLSLKNENGFMQRVDSIRCASAQEIYNQTPREFQQTDHSFGTSVPVNVGENTGDAHDYQCPSNHLTSSVIGFRLSDGSLGPALMACKNIRTGQLATSHTTGMSGSTSRLHGSSGFFNDVGRGFRTVGNAIAEGGETAFGETVHGLTRLEQMTREGANFAFNSIERGFDQIPAIPGVGNIVGRLNQGINYVGEGVNYIPVVGPATVGIVRAGASLTEVIAEATIDAPGAVLGTLDVLVNPPPPPPPPPEPITVTASGRAGCPLGPISPQDAENNRPRPGNNNITGIQGINVATSNGHISEFGVGCGTSALVLPTPPPPVTANQPQPALPPTPVVPPLRLPVLGNQFTIASAGTAIADASSGLITPSQNTSTPQASTTTSQTQSQPQSQPNNNNNGNNSNTIAYVIIGVVVLVVIAIIVSVAVYVKRKRSSVSAAPPVPSVSSVSAAPSTPQSISNSKPPRNKSARRSKPK